MLAGLREQNLTAPGDLAVIGSDDISAARLAAPPLTTVAFDLHGAGVHRAVAVVAALTGRERSEDVTDARVRVIQRVSSCDLAAPTTGL